MDIVTESAHDLAFLDAERCVTELQRGRPIALASKQPALGNGIAESKTQSFHIIRLVETLSASELESLIAIQPCQLVLTRQRAAAIKLLVDSSAVCLNLKAQTSADAVLAWAGLDTDYSYNQFKLSASQAESHISNLESLCAPNGEHHSLSMASAKAAINLARAAHALPAFIMYETDFVPNGMLSTTVATATAYDDKSGELMTLSSAHIPLKFAEHVELTVFREKHGVAEHVAITVGQPDLSKPVTVRLHSSCFTGDILGSMKCDCGEQLQHAITSMDQNGGGIVLYVSQEGRGIGLASKLLAYQLQYKGLDTIEANENLGFDSDERQYEAAVFMLGQLGVNTIQLMTNNPLKIKALKAQGINVVGRAPSPATVNAHNARYLETKRERSGHLSTCESHG